MRLYFVLPCTLSLTVFVRLYFVLRPQVFQLVPRQPLTRVVFFAVQLPGIQPLFSLPLFHSPSLPSSRRIFRSSFSSFSIRFRPMPFFTSTLLLIFSYSAFSISIVIQRSFDYKLTFFLPKKYCISFQKKICIPFQG